MYQNCLFLVYTVGDACALRGCLKVIQEGGIGSVRQKNSIVSLEG